MIIMISMIMFICMIILIFIIKIITVKHIRGITHPAGTGVIRLLIACTAARFGISMSNIGH